jgi:hypothetical protein
MNMDMLASEQHKDQNDIKELKQQLSRIENKIEHLQDILIMIIIIVVYFYTTIIFEKLS